MKIYSIPVTVTLRGVYWIEARTKKAALEAIYELHDFLPDVYEIDPETDIQVDEAAVKADG